MIVPSRVLGSSQQPGTGLRVCPSTSLRSHAGRKRELAVLARGRPGWDKNLRKGNFHKKRRRKGRPEWMRSPDDTPLRDGTRDRTIGLLTQRAVRTLAYYLSETNPNVYHWLVVFEKENPIPRDGAWDDVSGETFLRTLLSMPIEHASWGRGTMYACNAGCGVDPRSIAQRIMEIRSRIAKEMTQDLSSITEENSELIRETLQSSFTLDSDSVAPRPTLDAAAPPPNPDTAEPPRKDKPVNRIPRVTYRRPKPPRNTAARPPPPPDEAVEAFRAKLLESLGTQPDGKADSASPPSSTPPVDSVVSAPQDAADKSLGAVKDALSRALEKADESAAKHEKAAEEAAEETEKGVLGRDEAGKVEDAASLPEAKLEDVTSLPLEKKEEIVSATEEEEEVKKVEDAASAPEAKVKDVISPPLDEKEEIAPAPVEEVEAKKAEDESVASTPEAGVANIASTLLEKAEDISPVDKPKDPVLPAEQGDDTVTPPEAKADSLVPPAVAEADKAASQTVRKAEDAVLPPVANADQGMSLPQEKADGADIPPKDKAEDPSSPPVEKVDKDVSNGEGKADKA